MNRISVRMLDAIVRHSPAAIALLRGSDFRFEMVNPAYAALAPGEPMMRRTVAEVWPSAVPVVLPLLKEVRETRTPYHASGMAVPLHRGPGSKVEERYFDVAYAPVEGDRILVLAIEVTHHKRVERELVFANQELEAIHANAPMALSLVDEGLSGQRPGDAIGCINALADPRGCGYSNECGDCTIRNTVLDSLTNGSRHQGIEAWVPLRVEGVEEPRCLLVSTAPMLFDGSRKVLVCAQDITKLKRAVSQAESALAEKTVLFKELHHRVKNNLAVVSSLLRMKADLTGSEEVRSALEASHRRVRSMALIHEQLSESDHLDRINFSEYAKKLVHHLRQAVLDEPARVEIQAELDSIELGIEQAVPCGLILNELLTNAFKYAFPGSNHGRILVSFHEIAPGCLELAVEDNGVGLSPELRAGRETSMGLRIVAILTNQLDGVLEHQSCAGTRIVLRFPMRVNVQPPASRPT